MKMMTIMDTRVCYMAPAYQYKYGCKGQGLRSCYQCVSNPIILVFLLPECVLMWLCWVSVGKLEI
jgi:hypothetical protein